MDSSSAREQLKSSGPNAPGTYILKTFGCKANLRDSQLLETALQERGWRPFRGKQRGEEPPSLCIVNSCAVTDEADRQSRKMASRLARENPRGVVVVTGCSAEIDPERLAGTPGVRYVVGNRDKSNLIELVLNASKTRRLRSPEPGEILGRASGYGEMTSRHPMDREWPSVDTGAFTLREGGFADTTRAFLKIQEGCNAFCTYCVIPYGRGPSRSLEAAEVITQVRSLVDEGAREIVLTGTNLGDYEDRAAGLGVDAPGRGLEELVARILSETPLERLRLSSLDPLEIMPGLMRIMEANPRLCAHFHVSLQSPHSRILRAMKRGYSFEDVERALVAIAKLRPDLPAGVFVGMDVITGFPGETREEFEWSYAALERLPWTRLHVFPYSERAGTPAARMPGAVAPAERRRRAGALLGLSLARNRARHEKVLEHCAQTGAPLNGILLEKPGSRGDGRTAGHTPDYTRVWVRGAVQRNSVIQAKPVGLVVDEGAQEVALECIPITS